MTTSSNTSGSKNPGSKTPLLDTIVIRPADLRKLPESDLHQLAYELRTETDRRRLRHRRPSRRRPRRRRTNGCATPRLRHPERPRHLGTSAIRPIRTRSSPAVASASAPCARVAASQASPIAPRATTTPSAQAIPRPRSPLASAWRWPTALSRQRQVQRGRGHRRRRHVGRHGIRGHEQRRRDARAPHRHPQRQRDVDRPRRRARSPSYLARLVSGGTYRTVREAIEAARQAFAQVPLRPRPQDGGIRPQLLGGRHDVRGARLLLRRADRRP